MEFLEWCTRCDLVPLTAQLQDTACLVPSVCNTALRREGSPDGFSSRGLMWVICTSVIRGTLSWSGTKHVFSGDVYAFTVHVCDTYRLHIFESAEISSKLHRASREAVLSFLSMSLSWETKILARSSSRHPGWTDCRQD